MNNLRFVQLALCTLFFLNNVAQAWGPDKTHRSIAEYAANISILSPVHGDYLRNIGFRSGLDTYLNWNVEQDGQVEGNQSKRAIEWMKDIGARLEDGKMRELNHFFNPLKDWHSAGLHVVGIIPFGESTVLWAQDSNFQATWSNPNGMEQPYQGIITIPDSTVLTDWSWQKTRGYYYLACTSTSTTDREANFAKMFTGLGHQMHLLQDMSVPMHVRNDSHLFNRWIEEYVDKNIDSLMTFTVITMPTVSFAPTQNSLAPSPVANLFDTNQYNGTNPAITIQNNIGLAEYTNANFVSPDTIFTGFPYPALATSVITTTKSFTYSTGNTVTVSQQKRDYYWKNADGDTGYLLAGKPFIHFEKDRILPGGEVTIHKYIPPMDDNVHRDYAAKLLPRAVGYSAALLNYFFRETLEISAPTTSVYAITDGSRART